METENITKEYRTTKDICQSMINGRICRSCGGELSPIETVDNFDNPTFWAGCVKCSRFDTGVNPLIFNIAKKMVDEHYFIAYSYLGVKENHPETEWPEWYRSQYAGTCNIVWNVMMIHKDLTTDPK